MVAHIPRRVRDVDEMTLLRAARRTGGQALGQHDGCGWDRRRIGGGEETAQRSPRVFKCVVYRRGEHVPPQVEIYPRLLAWAVVVVENETAGSIAWIVVSAAEHLVIVHRIERCADQPNRHRLAGG